MEFNTKNKGQSKSVDSYLNKSKKVSKQLPANRLDKLSEKELRARIQLS